MLRHVDPQAELVACGHVDEWNEEFLRINQRCITSWITSRSTAIGLMAHRKQASMKTNITTC